MEEEEGKEEEELEAAGWCSEAGDESHSLLLLGNREIGLTIFTPFQQKVNKDVWRKQVTKTGHQNFAYLTQPTLV